MNIEFDSEPLYGGNDKQIKAKIKSYGDKVNTNFQVKKILKENASYKCLSLIMLDSVIRVCKKYYRQIPKENASYKCLSLIILDSVFRVSKKYFPQTLLEECKYEIKKTKMENLINDDLDLFDDETDNESDNETKSDKDE